MKYADNLLKCASRLDLKANSNGILLQCVVDIIEKKDIRATIELFKLISKISETSNKDILKQTIELKDALVRYYGYIELMRICKQQVPVSPIQNIEGKSLEELLDELNNLVGLENVKLKVHDLIAFHKVQLLRKNVGLPIPQHTMHMAFVGNPGTGKTTVARIVGRMYKQLGLLSKGHFMEVSRTDLIAGYQGQTALKVKKVIEKVIGGVLFIDEAYSITENEHSDSYGRECLTELTKALEDYRNDLVVIVAGYTEPMIKFFNSNPGLKSRFNTFIEFNDYNTNELLEMLKKICDKDNYILTDDVLDVIKKQIETIVVRNDKQFGNGRFIRNLYEEMIVNHAKRVININSPTKKQLQTFLCIDIPLNNYHIRSYNDIR